MFIGQTHVTVVDVRLMIVQFSLTYHVVCRSRCVSGEEHVEWRGTCCTVDAASTKHG
jgi:hypothetical protein